MEFKKYPISGTVTICTDEYRDLIKGIVDAEKEAESPRTRWYEAYNKANKLEAELKGIREEMESIRSFVESKKEYRLAYKMFKSGVEEDEEC